MPPVMTAEPAYLDLRNVARRFACSPRHILRLSERGEFPTPIKLGRSLRWRLADLIAWEQARAATAVK